MYGVAAYPKQGLPFLECSACAQAVNFYGASSDDGTSFWGGGVWNSDGAFVAQLIEVLPDGGEGWVSTPSVICPGLLTFSNSQLIVYDGGIYLSDTESVSPEISDAGLETGVAVYSTVDGSLVWSYCTVEYPAQLVAVGPGGAAILNVYDSATGAAGFAWVDSPGVLRWISYVEATVVDQQITASWLGANVAVAAEGTIYAVGTGAQGYGLGFVLVELTYGCGSEIFAINGADGGILWTVTTTAGPRGDSSPVIGGDGTIYFMDQDGYLNAIR